MKAKPRTVIFLVLALLAAGFLVGRWTGGDRDGPERTVEDVSASVWTCAMHPQVRADGPGSCPICGMDLVPLAEDGSGDGDIAPDAIRMSERALRLADVQTSVAGRPDAVQRISLNGKVMADESLVFHQAAHFPGRIEHLYVNTTGERLRMGQRIATLYSPELVTAQEELFEAKKFGQEELVASVRRKLKLWKLSDEEIAAIEHAGEVRFEIDILAHVDGIVTRKLVNLGDHVHEGSVMYEVSDLSRVWVEFDGYERYLAWVDVGDRISFTVPSVPGRHFEGKVSFIDPMIDPQTRTAAIRTVIDNSSGLLKPEMLAKGTLRVESEDAVGSMVVPASAVLWTGERSVVYVRVPDPGADGMAFVLREVHLGLRLGDSYAIVHGLEPGEEVVTSGTFTVDAAAQLQGKKSMMNPESGAVAPVHSHEH